MQRQVGEMKQVVTVSEGVDFRGLGALVKRVIYPQTTGCKNATLAVVFLSPGEEIVLHRHVEEELYYIYSGQGEVYLDDQTYPVTVGSAVYIGPNVVHGQRCTGQEPMQMVAVVAPPFSGPNAIEIVGTKPCQARSRSSYPECNVAKRGTKRPSGKGTTSRAARTERLRNGAQTQRASGGGLPLQEDRALRRCRTRVWLGRDCDRVAGRCPAGEDDGAVAVGRRDERPGGRWPLLIDDPRLIDQSNGRRR